MLEKLSFLPLQMDAKTAKRLKLPVGAFVVKLLGVLSSFDKCLFEVYLRLHLLPSRKSLTTAILWLAETWQALSKQRNETKLLNEAKEPLKPTPKLVSQAYYDTSNIEAVDAKAAAAEIGIAISSKCFEEFKTSTYTPFLNISSILQENTCQCTGCDLQLPSEVLSAVAPLHSHLAAAAAAAAAARLSALASASPSASADAAADPSVAAAGRLSALASAGPDEWWMRNAERIVEMTGDYGSLLCDICGLQLGVACYHLPKLKGADCARALCEDHKHFYADSDGPGVYTLLLPRHATKALFLMQCVSPAHSQPGTNVDAIMYKDADFMDAIVRLSDAPCKRLVRLAFAVILALPAAD